VPLKIRHVWKPLRSSDVFDMANAVAALYNNGLGILGEEPEIAYDMMGWPKTKLLEREENMPTAPKVNQSRSRNRGYLERNCR